MKRATDVPWEKIYDYVLTCGREHEPNNFVRVVLEEMNDLVPYDQGLVYCLDEHRRVEFQHLVNIKSRWSTMYLKYYSLLLGDDFNLTSDIDERFDIPYVEQITWSKAPLSEFITDYIMARGVLCTLGMVLFDQNSLPRVAFAFDRTRSSSYSDREIEIVRYAAAQLGNLYKNFYTSPSSIPGAAKPSFDAKMEILLTKREQEVVELLCRGLSPAHVSKTLKISVSTAYKHIAHIYKKLNVSSQQELLVKVLGDKQ